MTAEEKHLRDMERAMDHDIHVRYLRIKRIERMMSDELDPFGKEFAEMAEKLRELNEEQKAQALCRMNIHSEICDRFGLFDK